MRRLEGDMSIGHASRSLHARGLDQLRSIAVSGFERYGSLTSGARILPSFLIIGAQRGGTNSLYQYLADHPGVARAQPGQEVHYFDDGYHHGLDWYRGHFPTRRRMEAAEALAGVPAITGESSPYYLFHPLAQERIARTLPSVKLIVLLRDPVDRAFSHYQHARARGYETLSFEDALAVEPARLAGEEDRIISQSPGYASGDHRHRSYLSRGMYAEQLERLFRWVPRERVKVIISERLFTRPEVVGPETLRFLGLSTRFAGSYSQQNSGRYRDRLDPSLRRQLEDRFAGCNERLTRLLDEPIPW